MEPIGLLLLAWHDRSKLPSFPWRETNDPYRILVAEMLLRQTTREQVSKVYHKVVERYPDAHHLAAADPEELREMLRSLGLAHRTQTLLEVARELEVKGGVPSTFEELRELPGIGPYSASTILCMAFNQHLPMLDINSMRVLSRIFTGRESTGYNRAATLFQKLGIASVSRRLNLALLDFAHYVCTARNPKCETCPVNEACSYYRQRRA